MADNIKKTRHDPSPTELSRRLRQCLARVGGAFMRVSDFFLSLSGIKAIRNGLITLIPVLLVGAFALMIRSFPIDAYQGFISSALDGFIYKLLDTVYGATFGLLSIFMSLAIGYHYALIKSKNGYTSPIASAITSVAVFALLTGTDNLTADTLGAKGMFIAIIASLGASALFAYLLRSLRGARLLTDGADSNLNRSLLTILPISITVIIFAVLNTLLLSITDGMNIHDIFGKAAMGLFSPVGDGFLAGLLFVIISSVLWFFGIHGSDVLEGVSQELFVPKIDINIALLEMGEKPTEILTKQFFDIFVLMGGCGSAMCLLIALLIFSKRRSNKRLGRMAAFPMIFNINEIMVFGLPIIYNPSLIIPFLSVPVICYLTSYAAMATGLVPLTTASVEWTIPVVLGGYLGTGGIAGSLLQIFNLIIGTLIYRPFVIKYDEERLRTAKADYKKLLELFKRSEASRENVTLTELHGSEGSLARSIAADIEHAIADRTIRLHYQPQYELSGRCFGAEALLIYRSPELDTVIYPPLVIELMKEIGKLETLEMYIFEQVARDAERLRPKDGRIKFSVNLSGSSIQSREFEEFLIYLMNTYEGDNRLCIEITEQTAVNWSDELRERMDRLKKLGFLFAIDDFSAGSTSLQYLQESLFDIVKLDGNIVQNSISNPRCYDITALIIELSHTLGFSVIAEFVSSEEIRDTMAKAGCTMYQGWLYSPALEFDRLQSLLS